MLHRSTNRAQSSRSSAQGSTLSSNLINEEEVLLIVNPYEINLNQCTCGSSIMFIIWISVIVASTILSIILEDSIFQTSLGFQNWLQTNMNNEFLRVFMNLISNLVHPTFVVASLITIFAFSRRKFEILNFLIYFALVSYVSSILKTLFASPRPYWVGSDVQEWEWVCYQEYGNPSGHSLLGPLFYEFILTNYILPKIDKEKTVIKFLSKVLFFLLIALILFSRLYLGMHSLNQVVYGFILGCSLLALYRLYFRISFRNLLLHLIRINEEKKQATWEYIWIFVSFAIALAVPSVIYLIQENAMSKQDETQWTIQIEKKCEIDSLNPLKAFNNRCFIDCSGVCICFAILLGFLFTKHPVFLLGFYNSQSRLIYRGLVIILVGITFMIGFMILPTGEIVSLKFIFQSLGVFSGGFSLVCFAPKILFHFKMISTSSDSHQNELQNEQYVDEGSSSSSSFSYD